jgi:predicted small lipoprotein YifL
MLVTIQEYPDLTSLSDRRLCRIAAAGGLVGTLIVALGISGCGRKGGLEPPPAAVAVDPAVAGPAPENAPEGNAAVPANQPQRRTPIDWLID